MGRSLGLSASSWGASEASSEGPGAILGPLWGHFGALGRSLGAAMEAQRVSGATFLSRLDVQGSVRSENIEMLEFDDPLNGFAMFSRAQGPQNEVKIAEKTSSEALGL